MSLVNEFGLGNTGSTVNCWKLQVIAARNRVRYFLAMKTLVHNNNYCLLICSNNFLGLDSANYQGVTSQEVLALFQKLDLSESSIEFIRLSIILMNACR